MPKERPQGPRRNLGKRTLASLGAFWKRWGNLLKVAFAIIGSIVAATAFLNSKLNDLQTVGTSVAELKSAVARIETERLPALQDEYDALAATLHKIGTALDPDGRERIDRLLQDTESTQESLVRIEKRLSELESTARILPVLEEKDQRILAEHSEIKEAHRSDLADIRENIRGLTQELFRLRALAEVVKPTLSEAIVLGRIRREDLQELYSDEEVRQLVEDAKRMVEEGEVQAVWSGTLHASGSCDGLPRNCLTVSLLLPPSHDPNSLQLAEISLYYGADAAEVARLLHSDQDGEIRAAAEADRGTLCSWASSLASLS